MALEQDRSAAAHAEIADEELALGLRTVGWALLIFDWLVLAFIFVGLRSGSTLWLWWAMVQGALGLILIGAGTWVERRALSQIGSMRAPEKRFKSEH